MKIRVSLLALLLSGLAPVMPAMAADSDRLALVIGNAKYPDNDAPLKEPLNDARAVADELKRDGFDVEIGENLSGDAMRRAFDRLYVRIKPGAVVTIFFSGFGVQSARQSYILPVDAQIWTEADVRRDGLSLESILSEINNRGAGIKIALLDASRRNPFERRFRSFSAGLAPVIAPSGSLVMYSAALSSVIGDSGSDHGVFVGELLKEIRTPNLSAEEMLNRTRVSITRTSRGEQVPWISSSLAEDFSFVPGAAKDAEFIATAPTPQPKEPETAPSATQPRVNAASIQAPSPTEPAKPTAAPKQAETSNPVAAKDDPKLLASLADDPTIKTLNDKLAADPKDGNALYRRGQVYASKGAYHLAIKDFDETLTLNPKDVEALNNRCWTRTVIGDLTIAGRDCDEALRLRPDFVDALDSRGLLNLKHGQAKSAIRDFDAALKINPRLTSSLYGRGLAKQHDGKSTEGAVDISNAKAMDPNIVKEFASYGLR